MGPIPRPRCLQRSEGGSQGRIPRSLLRDGSFSAVCGNQKKEGSRPGYSGDAHSFCKADPAFTCSKTGVVNAIRENL